jgi:hypothetical protein
LSDDESLLSALSLAYGDSKWVDLRRIMDEVRDLSTSPQDSRRFYLNQVSDSDDAWIAHHSWAGVADLDAGLAPTDLVTLGFDGSRGKARGKPDATALIGCRVSDGHLFEVGVWEAVEGPGMGDWSPPMEEIDAALRGAFDRYSVAAFYADPGRDWRSVVNRWEAEHGDKIPAAGRVKPQHPFEYWMLSGRSTIVALAIEGFEAGVRNKELTHDGSYKLTQHVANCRRRIRAGKLSLAKDFPESPDKIDAAVAGVLAYDARAKALALGLSGGKKSRRMRFN